MPKGKRVFLIVAAVIVAIALLAILFSGDSETQQEDIAAATTATSPSENEEEIIDVTATQTLPSEAADPKPQESTYELAANVTVNQVEKDPNEVIDHTYLIEAGHPEYVNFGFEEPVGCIDGLVFRNDKTISIELEDKVYGSTVTVTFGYITGECNRFLYLNPVLETDLSSNPFVFKFGEPTFGTIYNVGAETEKLTATTGLYMARRTLDEEYLENAAYTNAHYPGTFWVAPNTTDCTVASVDILVLTIDGSYMATLRLTFALDPEDGTFSIVDLDDCNLCDTYEETNYTLDELNYILDMSVEVLNDPDQTHYAVYNVVSSRDHTWTLDDMMIDIRNKDTGLYFQQIVPADMNFSKMGSYYTDMGMDVLAVTFREHNCHLVFTLYFMVIDQPTETSHGTYIYVGRDYVQYYRASLLKMAGYEGSDL